MLFVVTDRADCVKGFETVISSNHVYGNEGSPLGKRSHDLKPSCVRGRKAEDAKEGIWKIQIPSSIYTRVLQQSDTEPFASQ